MVAKLRTVDMSLGGARVYSDERLKLGRKLHVELLADPGSTIQVLARVVWIDELEEGRPARYDVGLEFLEVPEEMTSRLAAILQKDEDYKRELEAPAPRDRVWEDEEDDDPDPGEKKQ
jgi:c-di-GMP-binding flagellar brake protein YcgR